MSSSDENGEENVDEPCTICGDPNSYNTDKFISCDNCNVGFHQSCYGLQKQNIKEGHRFTCYYCIHIKEQPNNTNESGNCALCSIGKNGLALTTMNSRTQGTWCHVICAYSFHCNFNGKSNKSLSEATLNTKDTKHHKKGKCCICNASKGYKLECVHPQCTAKIHPSCARINANRNDDSFYFDDIYNDKIYRNPLYFCTQHNIDDNNDVIKRKQKAENKIKQWNKCINKRKRKRETKNEEISDSEPISKKRKLNQKCIIKSEDDDESSEYKPPGCMETDDLMISTTSNDDDDDNGDEHMKNETEIDALSESEFSLDLMSSEDSTMNDAINAQCTETMLSASNSASAPINTKDNVTDDCSIPLYNRNAKELFKSGKHKSSSHSGSKIANIHDFRYCMDKCYCCTCLQKHVVIKTENEEKEEDTKMEKQDRDWFNHSVWFNRDYTLHDFNTEQKQNYTATFCKNINITTDYACTYNRNDNKDNTMVHTLHGYENVAMYNYSAMNNFENETQIPSKAFRNIEIKKGKRNMNQNSASLFYRKIYRDILMNCGGTVICMDFAPINKYHNLNGFNYLCVFADCDKYHNINTNHKLDRQHLIQIWKIKKGLKVKKRNKTKRGWHKAAAKHRNAVFHYGVLHGGGFIWDLKWLPLRIKHKAPGDECNTDSDYGTQYQRLGILAVCSDDNFVYIYSLPFAVKNDILMDINAVLKLCVTNEQFVRLSWSSNLLYPMLIASSSNGCVAVWDLYVITNKICTNTGADDCACLCDEQLNLIPCYSPNEMITGIDWCSDHLKYFITVSHKGCLRLWDINNLYTPVFTRKLHSLSTDIKWIPGIDSTLLTAESYAVTDCCTKLVSIWPQPQAQPHVMNTNYSRMGSVIQFPAEKLYNINDKVAFCIDVLLKCDCNNHDDDDDHDRLVSSDDVALYVVIGYSSGNVILYEQKLNELVNSTETTNGQIISQLIFDENENENNECTLLGPFYAIKSAIYRNQFNVSRHIWTETNKDEPIYDPYHLSAKQLALNDNVAIRKVKISPNGEYLDIVSASISGIIRIQTIES